MKKIIDKIAAQKSIFYVLIGCVTVLIFSFQSCSKWNDVETVEHQFVYPWERDPATWKKYFNELTSYKEAEHNLVYVSFCNSNDKGEGELNYMRSLPDSVDIVSLMNADNLSEYDKEDVIWMHKVGTKVLYHVDYATRMDDLSDESKLSAYLDKVIKTIEEYQLDGVSFSGIPDYSGADPMVQKASSIFISKFDIEGKLIVFEGDPKFVNESDRNKVDYFVLNTRSKDYEQEVKFMISEARDLGVKGNQLILSANMNGEMIDSSLEEVKQIDEICSMVFSQGPTAGIALYDIASDYYHTSGNYLELRSVIQKLN